MKEIQGIPVFQLTIDELSNEFGVSVMSFVDEPAVEKKFIALSNQKKEIKLSVDEEKHIVTGVALRANFPIYRRNEDGTEFYFTISEHEMVKIMQKFMKEKRLDSVNIMHDSNKMVNGVYLVESFLFNEHHKKIFPEFSDVEHGSWMVSYKVENDKVWKLIKDGTLGGFSVELTGYLESKEIDNEELELLINYLKMIQK